jgi:putative transposase
MEAPVRFHSRSLRNGRVSLPYQIYLVTFTTKQRARLFIDFTLACAACRALGDGMVWRGSSLLAWVLMPDHWHGLMQLEEAQSLSKVVGRAKAVSARFVNEARGGNTVVWQPGFHDRALRQDEAVHDAARYVIANPVRAGMVGRVEEYAYWNCVWAGPEFSLE